MLLDSVRSYNALAELAPLCPSFSAAEDPLAADLPESLAAEWINGAPSLRPIAFPAGEPACLPLHTLVPSPYAHI